jgi:hypothetical protein
MWTNLKSQHAMTQNQLIHFQIKNLELKWNFFWKFTMTCCLCHWILGKEGATRGRFWVILGQNIFEVMDKHEKWAELTNVQESINNQAFVCITY